MFKKIAIIGVGEIGGSIGLVSRNKLAEEVVGIVRRRSSAKKALAARTVDRATLDLKKGVEGADLIILAAPVGKIVELGILAGSHIMKNTLMTDAGSTKRSIVEKLERALPPHVKFVGAHPMAGTEKSGPQNARANLFANRTCFITPTKNTDKHALRKIKGFWRSMGSKTIVVSPEKHDDIVARISQMIHIVASSLVIANKDVLKYAASGFRDSTRIALGDPGLWKDICLTNSGGIAKSLNDFARLIKLHTSAISRGDSRAVVRMLENAQRLRSKVE